VALLSRSTADDGGTLAVRSAELALPCSLDSLLTVGDARVAQANGNYAIFTPPAR